MSGEYERMLQLECLRLASDLPHLARADLDPALKAHCLRMASVGTDRAMVPLEARGALLRD
jgi:hypothetical protein